MRYIIEDRKYRFKSAFDTKIGAYIRTGSLYPWQKKRQMER